VVEPPQTLEQAWELQRSIESTNELIRRRSWFLAVLAVIPIVESQLYVRQIFEDRTLVDIFGVVFFLAVAYIFLRFVREGETW